MRHPLVALLLLPLALAGCSSGSEGCPAGGVGEVRAMDVHVGTNADGSMYLTPAELRVPHCSKVRLVVHNDDKDVFHDVALLDYAGQDIEHEVRGGGTTKTCVPQADPDTQCAAERSYFVASEEGTFELVCEVRVPNHEDLGMKGKLVVE